MTDHPIRILVAGCGHMGTSHAKAYHAMPGFEIVGWSPAGEVAAGPARRGGG